jgi:ribonuclease HI
MKAAVDGCCKGNPGPGGWGIALEDGNTYFGGESATTNNRMELEAFLNLMILIQNGLEIDEIFIDSKYVMQGFSDWSPVWARKGWVTSQKTPVLNVSLWRRIHDLRSVLDGVTLTWVKGHSGHSLNEAADAAANKGALEYL